MIHRRTATRIQASTDCPAATPADRLSEIETGSVRARGAGVDGGGVESMHAFEKVGLGVVRDVVGLPQGEVG
ncbi:MAG: hypothetical protein QOH52_4461, partial [Pseudonocardiales bacterium]|nr:hypothetical protein [Pseudonocardiales bacterium]